MAFLTVGDVWVDDLYRIELDDPVEGGEDGVDNLHAKQLGSRTNYLKSIVDAYAVDITDLYAKVAHVAVFALTTNLNAGSGRSLYLDGGEVWIVSQDIKVGTVTSVVDLRGTVTVNGSPISGGGLPSIATSKVLGNFTGSNAVAAAVDALSTATANAVMVRDGNGDVAVRYLTAEKLTSASGLVLDHTRPSTDVRPPPTHIILGQATSLASGSTTAANKVGPHFALALGRGQTVGTDAPGGLFIGLGDLVSNAIADGMVLGTGAPVGTPGTDGYRPFTDERARFHVFDATVPEFRITGDRMRYHAASQGIYGGGSTAFFQGANAWLQATSGALVVDAVSGVTVSAGGELSLRGATNFELRASNRVWTFQTSGSEDRFKLLAPASATPASNAATPLGTATVVANKLTRLRATVLARLSSGNSKIFEIEALVDNNGTTATVTAAALATQKNTVGTCQGTGAGAPLATGDFTTSVSGLVVTLNVANGQGISFSLLEELHQAA